MKKSTFKCCILSAVMIFCTADILFMQAQDIVDVPDFDEGKPAMYDFIMGDTTETGDRKNPDRIYRLEREKIYFLDQTMSVDWNLTLMADDDDPSDPKRPPMIVAAKNLDGVSPTPLLNAIKDSASILFKNLLFQAVPTDKGKTGVSSSAVHFSSENSRMEFDRCIFNGYTGGAIGTWRNGYRLFVHDCVFRNLQPPTSWWEADAIIGWNKDGDSVVIVNNTFFNCGGALVNNGPVGYFVDYFEFDHNTVLGNQFQGLWTFGLTNVKVTNNLFVDTYATGISQDGVDAGWVDADALPGAIVPVDTNDVAILMEKMGITESERKFEVHNNAYGWSQKIKDFWVAMDHPWGEGNNVFMNERDLAFFADDTNYPLMNESNNIEAEPGFDIDMQSEVDTGYIAYGTQLYTSQKEGTEFTGYFHHYPDGNFGAEDPDIALPFDLPWPLPEDLTYTNVELATHSLLGYHVGDLNWYPDEMTFWEKGYPNGMETKNTASESHLSNYPNPFTTETTISYYMNQGGHVRITVYDISGREISVLVDRVQAVGQYKVQWDGTDLSGTKLPGGLYFCRFCTENENIIQKFILSR